MSHHQKESKRSPAFISPAKLDLMKKALKQLRAGKMIIVVDDEERENEGDLIMSGEKINARAINFMAKEGRGLICAPVSIEICKKLELYPMAKKNTEAFRTNFTISVDYRHGTSTGISASDRAKTIKALSDPTSKATDFAQPGHIFPIQGCEGGIFIRPGHTEATLDLMKLANLRPVGVLCEIAKKNGEMARLPDLKKFAKKHGLLLISIQDLIAYRHHHEKKT